MPRWRAAELGVIIRCQEQSLIPLPVALQAASESSTDWSGQCVSVLIGSGIASNTILGAPFLRGFYSVYSYDMQSKAAQIGFAQAAQGSRK